MPKVVNSLFDVQALWAAFNSYSHSPGPAPFRRQSPRLRDERHSADTSSPSENIPVLGSFRNINDNNNRRCNHNFVCLA